MTIHRSDTVNPVASAHAVILRNVAMKAIEDARAAWIAARDEPSEEHVRDAYRRCLLAARCSRKAADVMPPRRALQLLEEAHRLDVVTKDLSAQLARIVEGADPAPRRG